MSTRRVTRFPDGYTVTGSFIFFVIGLVTHPILKRWVASPTLKGYKGDTLFLIEISAGAGMVIRDSFDEVRAIMDGVAHEKVAVCFDTAHAFASGYDLRNEAEVKKTAAAFKKAIGFEHLILSHCNDSKVDLGERKDRHEHLGKGFIGLEGFKAMAKTEPFASLDLILETPHDEFLKEDIALLKKLRS